MSVDRAIGLLRAVLDVTPEPPAADDARIHARAEAMVTSRSSVLDELRALLGATPALLVDNQDAATLLDAIAERDRGWSAALQQARREHGQRLGAMRRQRQRTPSPYRRSQPWTTSM